VDRLSLNGRSLELVNGELLDRSRKKPPHIYWKTILGGWLREMFGGEYVRSEDPIDVAPEDNPTSEPAPDLIVTYQSIHVTRAGIREFWVLDVREVDSPRLLVHLAPTTEGAWKQVVTYKHDENVTMREGFVLSLMNL
jgi:hypothetical protein